LSKGEEPLGNDISDKEVRAEADPSREKPPVNDSAFPPYPLTSPTPEEKSNAPCSWLRSRRQRRQRKRRLKHLTQKEREHPDGLRHDLRSDIQRDKSIKTITPEIETKSPKKCLLLAEEHYVVSGTIGVTAKYQIPKQFVLDTGAGYNVIRRNALPPGWEQYVTTSKGLPSLGDAGGHTLNIQHEVVLRVRFGNSLYRVAFLVAEKLSVPVILGTQFTNRHVDAIRCMLGRVDLVHDSIPIVGRGDGAKPWQQAGAHIEERVQMKDGTKVKLGDSSSTLTQIRLVKPLFVPAFTQCKASVSTLMKGVIVTEPKHSVVDRYGVRVMNSVHDVQAGEPFHVLMSNFTSRPRLLPKGMVVAYASRSPLGFVQMEGEAAKSIASEFGIATDAHRSQTMEAPLPGMMEAESVFALIDVSLKAGVDREQAYQLLVATVEGDQGKPSGKPETKDDNHPFTERIETEAVPGVIPTIADVEDEEPGQKTLPDEDWRDRIDLSHLEDEKFKKRVMDMLEKHAPVFEGKLGTIESTEHRIHLKPGTQPVRMQPYRAGPEKREKIREQIEYQLAAGVIEPAQTEWSTPVLLAPKKDGNQRFCIDFRRLNAATIPDTYPLPRMDDCIDSLSEANVFTLLDALWGYWQIPLAECDRDKTTFTSHLGTYRCLRMPFGLRNAPLTFQRALDIILSGVRWRICLVYIDDVIVFSKNHEEHIEHLDEVLTLLQEAGIKLKLKKCFFFRDEVEYLGFRIRPGTLSASPDAKARAAINIATFPTTSTQMKSFLGCCNVYRRFIKGFAKVSTPLTDMLKKDSGTEWGDDLVPTESQRKAFETLKEALVTPPILALPKRGRPYMVDCDASAYAVGAVLLQQQDEKDEKSWATIGYYSKTLTKEQRNYSASERECYAVVWSTLTLRPYLEGSHFKVRTDHNALKWMLTLNDPSGRLMRWRLRLMEYDYEIVYRPGLKHQVPDALSRLPRPDSQPEDEVDDELPTYVETVEQARALTAAVTRRQTRQSAVAEAPIDDVGPSTHDAAPPVSVPAASRPGTSQSAGDPVTKPLVRQGRLARTRDHTWKDTSHLPLPDEDDEDDTYDLVADARDALLAGKYDQETEAHCGRSLDDTPLPSPLTLPEIIEEKEKDEFCTGILTSQVGRKGSLFFEDDSGILCRRHPREEELTQIVLPKSLRHRVLRLAHYHPLAGHPGHTRLQKRLRRTYYWPQMAADAAHTVRECIPCSKNRLRLLKQAGAMRLFRAVKPLEDLAIDILGPLPKSTKGYTFILVITDRFTKLTQAVPLRSIKALDVSIALVNEWIFKYGAPKRLLSDNGSQFISDLFSRVCSMLYVRNALTMTYHPQTNGQTERFNRSLAAMLRCYVEDHPHDWCDYVRALTYAYNTSVHRGIDAAPFDLVLSRSPPDFTIDQTTGPRGRKSDKFDRSDIVSRLRVAIGRASASLKKHQLRYKRDFDKHIRRSAMSLTTEDKVYLDLNDGAQKRDKLSHNVGGAYKILEVDPETKTIVIQRGDFTERVSMNRVTRAPRDAPLAPARTEIEHAATPEDLAAKSTGPSWYFKSILDHRTLADGSVEFKLDWEGHRPSWVGRPDVPEESISRYFARLADRRAREIHRRVSTVVEQELPRVLPRSRCTDIYDHRFRNGDPEFLVYIDFRHPFWASSKMLDPALVNSYVASFAQPDS